jgi:hypothetical protein
MPSGQPGFRPGNVRILDPQDNRTVGGLISKPYRYAMGISGFSSASKAFFKNTFGIKRPGAAETKMPMR